jgi:hypothetical protein
MSSTPNVPAAKGRRVRCAKGWMRSAGGANRPNGSATSYVENCTPLREARESPQMVEQEPERAGPRPVTVESQQSVQRPWWRRVFGR